MAGHIVPAVPAARWKAKTLGLDLSTLQGSGPGGIVLLRDLAKGGTESPGGSPRISPVARKLAEALGVPMGSLIRAGSGKRIMLEDVIRAAKGVAGANERTQEPLLQPLTIPMDPMRKAIARRMTQSAQTAPQIHLFCDIEMERLEQTREELLPLIQDREGVKLSINDLIIKATALTLREFPLLNARLDGEQILVSPEINVGLAVAVGQGLIVPAIPRADRLGLGQIAKLRSELVEKARKGGLKLEELERGTFTISSLAKYPILFFTAILNPPQSGLLTVGRTREELSLLEGRLILRRVARMGLSADHRIVDGATGSEFLQALKARLESPVGFLVGLD
jgi:pyruvate dehydrogenase E2 component (dihydrolipoamide acetyltransferase)